MRGGPYPSRLWLYSAVCSCSNNNNSPVKNIRVFLVFSVRPVYWFFTASVFYTVSRYFWKHFYTVFFFVKEQWQVNRNLSPNLVSHCVLLNAASPGSTVSKAFYVVESRQQAVQIERTFCTGHMIVHWLNRYHSILQLSINKMKQKLCPTQPGGMGFSSVQWPIVNTAAVHRQNDNMYWTHCALPGHIIINSI